MSRISSGLIAHYKCNENTVSDNDELVTNGTFAVGTGWTLDGWAIVGGVATSAGDSTYNNIKQNLSPRAIVGRKYRISYEVTANTLVGRDYISMQGNSAFGEFVFVSTVGTHSCYKVCTQVGNLDFWVYMSNATTGGSISIDNVSVKLCAVEDSSGNDHDGLLAEDTDAAHVAGKINGAFDFNGTSDFIEIADHADFTPALTPFSISAWVYMHSATNFIIASKGVEATDGEWRFYTDGSDKLFAHFYDESINKYIGRTYDTTALTANQNTWIHLVMTYDGGILSAGVKLYLNGAQVDDADSLSATFVAVENLTHTIWIGRYDSTYANGLIDNVMFFSAELTPTEVKKAYNNGHGTEYPYEIDVTHRPTRNREKYGL